ncbi:MAG: HNH endonuclease [Rhodovulum sp.]
MKRFMAKLNAEHLPGLDPARWEGQCIHVPKLGARKVETTDRRTWTEIALGDEIWICTDATGPGIAARASIDDIQVSAVDMTFTIRGVEVIPRPIALSDFGRLESGSRLISQLQRYRLPDLYILDEEIFREFEQVILDRLGSDSLPPQIDWGEIVARNRSRAREQFAAVRDVPLALRPVREGQGAFRDSLMRLYGGRCLVTGCSVPSAVEAAHILPWTGDPDLDRPENGLILRRDIHGLFDAGLLGLDPQTGQVVIAEALRGSEYEDLDGKAVEHHAAPQLVAERFALFTAPNTERGTRYDRDR